MLVKRTTEERENLTVDDILQKLGTLSINLQLEYLENLNKRNNLLPTIRVLVCKKLSEIYGKRNLFTFAASVLKQAAEHAVLYKDRRDLFFKIGELLVKAEDYRFATEAFNNAIEAEKPSERAGLFNTIRNTYFSIADNYEKRGRATKAIEVYESVLKAPQESDDINKIRLKLSELYGKVGRIKESIDMRNSVK